jgi:hypothetical protein
MNFFASEAALLDDGDEALRASALVYRPSYRPLPGKGLPVRCQRCLKRGMTGETGWHDCDGLW